MSISVLTTLKNKGKAALNRFARSTDGVAAVEFALLVPIISMLFIGAVEMSQAVTANRKVTQVGSAAGDLVARASDKIKDTDIVDIMKVGSYLLDPYPVTNLRVNISVIGTSTTSASQQKIFWTCAYNATAPNSVTCSCPKQATTVPNGLLAVNDYLVKADVTYGYKPPYFDMFMKKVNASAGGLYSMTETVYLKPRSAAPTLVNGGVTCDFSWS
jgi:Flp pilus assembly protein TadG